MRTTPDDAPMPEDASLLQVSPFFIVRSLRVAVDHYRERLGFESLVEVPEDDPFFALVGRDGVTICLKEIGEDAPPCPNHTRHEWARWDAFVRTLRPDALYQELCGRGATVHEPLGDTEDGLRAFELRDADGYVLCFGCGIGEASRG
jgi:uncharacterized glyoxalase superfamily protein PhnB